MQRHMPALMIFALVTPFALLSSVPASASETQLTTAVQLRSGPGDSYPAVKRLAKGLDLKVYGCLQTWDWCDVDWRGARGWVPAQSVEFQREDRRLPLSRYGTNVGVPVVGFSLGQYWDANYNQEPWYGERDRWMQRSARLESGGVMIENAVETSRTRRAPVTTTVPIAAVPPNPHVGEPLSAPVNAEPSVTTTTTTTITTTTAGPSDLAPLDPDF